MPSNQLTKEELLLQALKEYKRHAPKVIMDDYDMGFKDGMELIINKLYDSEEDRPDWLAIIKEL